VAESCVKVFEPSGSTTSESVNITLTFILSSEFKPFGDEITNDLRVAAA
jgi:hypothetical protein